MTLISSGKSPYSIIWYEGTDVYWYIFSLVLNHLIADLLVFGFNFLVFHTKETDLFANIKIQRFSFFLHCLLTLYSCPHIYLLFQNKGSVELKWRDCGAGSQKCLSYEHICVNACGSCICSHLKAITHEIFRGNTEGKYMSLPTDHSYRGSHRV